MVKASSWGKRSEKEGRLPGNSLCLRSESFGVCVWIVDCGVVRVWVWFGLVLGLGGHTLSLPPPCPHPAPLLPLFLSFSTGLRTHLDPLDLELLQGLPAGQRVRLREEVGHELVVVRHRLHVGWLFYVVGGLRKRMRGGFSTSTGRQQAS